MIQRVYENALLSPLLSDVIVATDSNEIADVIKQINGKVMMTASHFNTGTERAAEAAGSFPDADVIVNLQGDEPFIKPILLEQLLTPFLAGETLTMSTLARPLEDSLRLAQSTVKVMTDINHNAIYFSRSSFSELSHSALPLYHHIGLYAFRADFLQTYKALPETPLEQYERLEQLRVIEHGYKIRVCFTSEKTLDVNTKEEYEAAQKFDFRG